MSTQFTENCMTNFLTWLTLYPN